MKYIITKIEFEGYGLKQKEDGVYLCQEADSNKTFGVDIYGNDFKLIEKIDIPSELAYGNVFCVFIFGLQLDERLYKFFNGESVIPDKYSKSIVGLESFGKEKEISDLYSELPKTYSDKKWNNDKILKTPYNESIFYIVHPRGYTMLDESVNESKGTFEAIKQKAAYISGLGITSVIFMPVYERIEKKAQSKSSKYLPLNEENPQINYWGFGTGFYYAIKKSYCHDTDNSDKEFKDMIMAFHKKNIEVILSFDFNNIPYEEISNILKYWIYNYHIDGFRIFGTNEINKILSDPFLKDTKILLENYYDISNDPKILYKNIAVFDDEFKNYSRKFLKSDDDCVSRMSYYLRENHNNYESIRNITDFDGFTLNDLVSYDHKHNELNNENNNDGTNYNYSWNCGEEGESNQKQVLKLRQQQIRNALFMIYLSQGAPCINAGDELLNTSFGNNNPYCQDNEISWLKWTLNSANKEIIKLIKDLSAFRKRHIILHQPKELKLFDYMSCKLPDVSFHGEEAWKLNINPDCKQFSILYSGAYSKQYIKTKDCSIMLIFNMHWEEKSFALPMISPKEKWKLLCSTDSKCSFDEKKCKDIDQEFYLAEGRSISILLSM